LDWIDHEVVVSFLCSAVAVKQAKAARRQKR
jgi:hypothetical protein